MAVGGVLSHTQVGAHHRLGPVVHQRRAQQLPDGKSGQPSGQVRVGKGRIGSGRAGPGLVGSGRSDRVESGQVSGQESEKDQG